MTDLNTHPASISADDALWEAYRRNDKAAVTNYLFRRSLVGVGLSRSFPRLVVQSSSKKDRAAKRAHAEPMLINGNARQIPLQSTVN